MIERPEGITDEEWADLIVETYAWMEPGSISFYSAPWYVWVPIAGYIVWAALTTLHG